MVNPMTDQSTTSVQNRQFVVHIDDTLDACGDSSQSATAGVASAASAIRDVLTPAEWEELAEFMYTRVEPLCDEFRTRDDFEHWLKWVNSDAAKEVSDSIPVKLRLYVECRLREYQSTLIDKARDSKRTGNDANPPCAQLSFQSDPDGSRFGPQQSSSRSFPEAPPTDSSPKSSVETGHSLPEPFKLEEEIWAGWGCVPNVLLRSSVFAGTRVSLRTLHNQKVASFSNVSIIVTGPQLTQPDLDVWMQAVYLARHGEAVQINRRALLERLGRTTGSSDREWLTKSLARISECHIDVSIHGQRRFSGCLLQSLKIYKQKKDASDANRSEIELMVDPSMATLFRDGWTMLKFSGRAELRGDPLANWVLGFYRSHRNAYDMKVETLHRLCGIGGSLGAFRQRLERSLVTLVSGDHLGTAVITNDKVSVARTVMPASGKPRSEENERRKRLRRVANRSRSQLPRVGQQKQHIQLIVWQHIIRWCRHMQTTFHALLRQGWTRIRGAKGRNLRGRGTHPHN